jgi:alpha-tubulin suppressor-like RCC1 family protein
MIERAFLALALLFTVVACGGGGNGAAGAGGTSPSSSSSSTTSPSSSSSSATTTSGSTSSTSSSSTSSSSSGSAVVLTAISLASKHACALTSTGGAQCWGDNGSGELGDGSATTQSQVPVGVSGLASGVAAIAAGGFNGSPDHTCALTTAGTVLCWGSNDVGELGNGTTVNSNVPVAVSGLPAGAVDIVSGDGHSCVRTSAGAVLCWGDNESGQLGDGTTTNSPVPVAVTGLSSGVASISAGNHHTCAVTTAGAALCWGDDPAGELGNDMETIAGFSAPVPVMGLSTGVAAITAGGDDHSCAITTAGAALCWGINQFGQLGNDATTSSAVPVPVSGLSTGVAAITTGGDTTCALTTAGVGLCWGNGGDGELGNGMALFSHVPVGVVEP